MALTPAQVFRKYVTDGVPGSGFWNVKKAEIIQLLNAIIGGTAAIGDFQGAWGIGTDYIKGDLVENGGSIWSAKVDNIGVTPIAGATWRLFLPGVSVADGAVTLAKLADASAQAFSASVASYAALKALSTSRYTAAVVTDAMRGGNFERSNADLSATLSNLSVTSTAVDSATEIITKAAHGLSTGDAVIATTAVNGLALNTVYYAISLSSSTYALATTLANARAGTKVNLTGTTNFTVKRLVDPLQGVYVIATGNALDGSNGAWIRRYSGRANVRWFGALGGGVADDVDVAAIQAAINLTNSVFIPNGNYSCSSAVVVTDYTYLDFESQNAIITANHNGAGIEVKDKTTDRHFFATISSGRIVGGGTTSYGVDFANMTYGKLLDTFITGCANGWRNGGAGQSAYYNEARGVAISTCGVGVINGTLGNESKMFGGSIKDCTVCASDDDNSGTVYEGVAMETFTAYGVRLSATGSASTYPRILNCRFENPSTGGAYASAVAIRVNPATINARIRDNYISVVATGLSDSGVNTGASGN